jgi:sodium-dependent dicarboxylate transporter 2/3/5
MGEAKKINTIHYIICALFCFGFRFLPPVMGITPLGMGILGTFIGAIYGWMTIDMLWPSLIALAGIGWSIGMNQMLAASFGNLTVVALIFCTPLFMMASETGAFNWIIDKLLTSKAMAGKGFITVWCLLLIAFFMGWNNPIIMCLIFCGFVTSICKQVGIAKNEKFPIYMYIGIAFASMMGQILFPFFSTGLTLIMAYNAMFPNFPLDFVTYILFVLPMGVIMVTVYTLLMKFVFRVDVSKISNFKSDGSNSVLTKDMRTSLIIFIAFMVLMLAASLPLGAISAFLNQFGLVGISFIMIGMLAVLKREDGVTPICDFNNIGVAWGQVLMVAFIMVIATYMNTPDTGISQAMAALLMPFTQLPPIVFVIVALAFAAILTNVANNMIVVVLVMPIMFNFASVVGLAPTGMIALLFLLAQFAIATPAASPVTAVAMSQEMADPGEMTKAALKIFPLLFIVAILIGWPFAQILF